MSSELHKFNLTIRKGYQIDQRDESEWTVPWDDLTYNEKLMKRYGIDDIPDNQNTSSPLTTSQINSYLQQVEATNEPERDEEFDGPMVVERFHKKRKGPKHSHNYR